VPDIQIVINVSGGLVQDVFCSDQAATAIVVDWDTDGASLDEPGLVAVPDGRQALRLGGFTLGVREDLLVPAPHVLKSAAFDDERTVSVGTAGDWFAVRQGPWTVWLRIDRTSRFPRVDDVFPQPERASSTLELSTDDAEFLRQSLSRLPDSGQDDPSVTIELGERIALRAKDGSGRVTELVATGSRATGRPVAMNANRRLVERAVTLGFRRLLFFDPHRVVLCIDGAREAVWLPLDPQGIVPTTDDAVRVESHMTSAATAPSRAERSGAASFSTTGDAGHRDYVPARSVAISTPRIHRMSHTPENDQPNAVDHTEDTRRSKRRKVAAAESGRAVRAGDESPLDSSASQSPIDQAEQLTTALREALRQSRELLHGLRRQKKHTRLVQSTLDSLKQLHGVAG
jgi:hypothetical protein